jgi:hypothetical protein
VSSIGFFIFYGGGIKTTTTTRTTTTTQLSLPIDSLFSFRMPL